MGEATFHKSSLLLLQKGLGLGSLGSKVWQEGNRLRHSGAGYHQPSFLEGPGHIPWQAKGKAESVPVEIIPLFWAVLSWATVTQTSCVE